MDLVKLYIAPDQINQIDSTIYEKITIGPLDALRRPVNEILSRALYNTHVNIILKGYQSFPLEVLTGYLERETNILTNLTLSYDLRPITCMDLFYLGELVEKSSITVLRIESNIYQGFIDRGWDLTLEKNIRIPVEERDLPCISLTKSASKKV